MLTPQLKQALVAPEASTSAHSAGVRSTSGSAAGRAINRPTAAVV